MGSKRATTESSLFRLEFWPDLAVALDATRQAKEFLLAQGLTLEEADGWRLALTEAANNVVLHGSVAKSGKPVRLEISCRANQVEAQIVDAGPGFQWPTNVELPEPTDEHHRGLYLITALADRVEYRREPGQNRLILQKARQCSGSGTSRSA